MRKEWKQHLLSFSVGLFLILVQINAISGRANSKAPKEESNSGEHNGMRKRQTAGSFGFQHNSLPTSASSYYQNPSQYDSRSNSLYPNNNLRIDYNRDQVRDYYYPPVSSSAYSGRSSAGGSSSNGGGYYREKDDYRGDYRGDRDRQPYNDDYRYNNGYQSARDREEVAAQNLEYMMRNGQQRHAEYQKRIGQVGQTGQEQYDPFYFIGIRNKNLNPNNNLDGNLIPTSGSSSSGRLGPGSSSFIPPPSSSSSMTNNNNGLLSPSTTSGSGSASAVNSNNQAGGPNSNSPNLMGQPSSSSAPANHPLRNRRNSHQRPDDFYNNDIGGDKYELMNAKSAYPPERNNHNNHHQWANHHHQQVDQQFLTREQLVRQHPVSCHTPFLC
jgi:hypothetical protein